MSVFFTADTHFSHKKIIEYCPNTRGLFLLENNTYDIIRMNQEIIKIWNSTVSENDSVYFLGDWALSHNVRNKILPLLNG